MKIGIITFWQSNDNYGQVLQCFALQQQLIKLGHKPFLIKYVPLQKIIRTSIAGKIVEDCSDISNLLEVKKNAKSETSQSVCIEK